MKKQKKFVSVLILIAIIMNNIIFPLQGVVYAFGDEQSKTIDFRGHNLVVNEDGSVTFDCEVEGNTGRLTFTLYNAENQLIHAEPMVNWDEEQQTNVPNGFEAWANLGTTSYEGCYCIVSSEDVDLTNIRFNLVGKYQYLVNNRLDLPTDTDHISIDYYNIRPLQEIKEVSFNSQNLSVNQDGSVNIYCNLEYNSGMVKIYLYNSDGTKVNIEKCIYWNPETETNYESDTDATGKLNTTTYQGAYLIMSSDEVDLTKVILDIDRDAQNVEVGENGRVDLPNIDFITIQEHIFKDRDEKKEIFFHSNNLEINDNGEITLECNLEDNTGKIFVTPYNSDGTVIKAKRYDEWDEEKEEWGKSSTDAYAKVNGTTYDGAYFIVHSNQVNLSDLKFDFSGKECLIGENGKVDLTGCQFVKFEDISYKPMYEKKRVEFRSNNLVFSENGTVTMDTEIEGNEGQITFELHNADGSKVNINKSICWNEELQQEEFDSTRGEGILNTITYEGAYLIVTTENVDLSDIVFDFAGNITEINEEGRVDLPANVDWILIEPYCFREKNEKKIVHFYFDNIQVNDDGTLTIPCTLKNNQGTLKLTLFNSNGTKVNIRKNVFWNPETEQDYESDTDAEGKLNTSTYEGAYFIVTSEDVNVANIKFRINDKDVLIDANGKATLNSEDYIHIDKYTLKNVNSETTTITVNATSTGANFTRLFINAVDFTNENTTNSVNATHDVEELDEDRIVICIEEGKIIKTIKVNEQEGDLSATPMNMLDFDFPHADTYSIEITCEDDPNYLPSIKWAYNNPERYGEEAIVENGTVEVVSVTLPGGETVYNYDELLPEDIPGIGKQPKHHEAYLVDEELKELYTQVGSTVVLRIIPDKGYEVSSLNLDNGTQLIPDSVVPNQYSLVMPNNTTFLSGIITKTKTYFDVTDPEFGAIPNDEIDDYQAIFRALRKARNIDETITVYVPAGNYIISNQLIIYSNTKLILDKDAVIKSTLSEDNYGMLVASHNDEEDTHGGYTKFENIEISGGTWDRNSSSDIISSVFSLRHGQNINIHDLTVENCTEHMINISADKDVTIKNVVFQKQIPYTGTSSEFWGEHTVGDSERYKFTEAIHTDTASDGEKSALPLDNTTCDNIVIEECIFNGVFSGVGNHHESEYKTKNVTVKNCEFTNMQYGEAVNAWSFDSITVSRNTLTNSKVGVIAIASTGTIANNSFIVSGTSTDYGVIHLENSDFEINNNTIQNASNFSIRVMQGNATIVENNINGSVSDGIKAENATKLQINNNAISNIVRYPIFIKNCEEQNVISENTITAPSNASSGNSAVLIEKSGNNNTVEKNNIFGYFEYDIYLIQSNGTINNNTLAACKSNAISVDNSTVTINQNKITNAGLDGIHLNSCNSIVSSNEITNPTSNAIYALNGKATIANNTINKTEKDGIRVDYLSEINANNNILKNIGRYGIYVSNSSSNTTISSNEVEGSNTSVGIFIEKCSGENLVEKNTLKTGSFAGIFASKCKGTILQNNVTECSGDALQIMGDADNVATFTVKDNTLITASKQNYDIRLYPYSKDCVIKNNTLGTRGLKAESNTSYSLEAFTGIKEESDGSLVYYKNGIKDNSTGLVQSSGTWYYIKNGVVDTSYTGLVQYSGKWFYVQKGILHWGVKTLVQYYGTWYYVNNSTLDWNYTGLCQYGGSWYYVQKGTLKWGAKTLVQYGGTWYYVNNSTLDWSYTGLCYFSGKWYYIQKGQLNWGIKTLVQYNGTWYYVDNSTLDWNYTGLCQYNGSWFYVQKGQINWGVRTLTQYYGTWYYVNNSKLDWNYTGLCEYNGKWYYIQKGVLKWGYNGNVVYNGKTYTVRNSTVV